MTSNVVRITREQMITAIIRMSHELNDPEQKGGYSVFRVAEYYGFDNVTWTNDPDDIHNTFYDLVTDDLELAIKFKLTLN